MSLKTQLKADRVGNQQIAKALKAAPLTATSTGAAVKAAERMLKIAGFDVGKVDGKFDAKSLAALAKLDAATGKPADNAFDASTFAALKTIQSNVRKHGKDIFLGKGQAGAQVAAAEKRLKKLGYDVGKIDGVFDADTAKAVKAFKKDEGIKGNAEFLGNKSTKALASESKALDHQAYRGRVTKDLKAHRRLDALTAKTAASATGIGAGSNKRAVSNIQAHLRAAGYNPSRTDGVFDSRTQNALEVFQKRAGLPVTGTVNTRTWKELSKATFEAKTGTSPAQRLGEKSGSVKATEQVLRKLGYKGVKADGIFDKATLKAVKAFEKKYPGLGRDGAIDAKELTRMKQVAHAKANPGSGAVLKKGFKGAQVKTLEKRLKAMGFSPGSVDGKFSEATRVAVKRFQKAFNLKADGVVGKNTWRMLGVDAHGSVSRPGDVKGIHVTAAMKRLASASRNVASNMGGYNSQGLCATGVSRAISRSMGIAVYGNGNQIDNNLPRSKFRQVHISLAQALKIPGLILTWEHTSTALGRKYGHTAITSGNGSTSTSDFIERNTLAGARSRTGLKIFVPI